MLSTKSYSLTPIHAGDVKPYQVIKVPEFEQCFQVLVMHRQKNSDYTEIIYNGRPYVYHNSQLLGLVNQVGHE